MGRGRLIRGKNKRIVGNRLHRPHGYFGDNASFQMWIRSRGIPCATDKPTALIDRGRCLQLLLQKGACTSVQVLTAGTLTLIGGMGCGTGPGPCQGPSTSIR